jgi:hypothetical protein
VKEFEDHPSTMDDEPRAVYSAQRYEDTALWQTPDMNSCVKLLLESYHGGYLWLIRRIKIDPMLINRIIGLSMQSPNPHDYYPRKTVDRALDQKIKEAYGDVEKGMRGYKVASIESGIVDLTCQMTARNLVCKN